GRGFKMRQVTRARAAVLAATSALGITVVMAAVSSGASSPLSKVNHIVVIYEENHSFDNLYGGWEGVNGLKNADAAHTTQIDQAGVAYGCLRHNDVNLAAMAATCTDAAHSISNAVTKPPCTIDATSDSKAPTYPQPP